MLGPIQDILNTIIFGTILFLAMAIVIIISIIQYQKGQSKYKIEKKILQEQFQQQILQAQLETQEETFDDISAELHDNIGQLLNTSKLLLGIVQRNPQASEDTLKTIEETLAKAINDIRSLSKSLNRDWLQKFHLLENLDAEIQRINQSGTFYIQYIRPDNLVINTDKQIILFRIIQEAIQNTIKHAHASKGSVEIIEHQDNMEILIKDNGSGFSVETIERKGLGMHNMEHRMALLGGHIQWLSDKDGTTVALSLPYNNQ